MTTQELESLIQSVSDRLLHLGGADYESDREISLEEAIRTGNVNRDFGIEEWDWPQGVGLYGLLQIHKVRGNKPYTDFFANWFESNLKKGLPSRNINTTAPYLTLLELLEELPNREKYESMCIDQANWLVNELPKTKEGGFQHVTSGIGDRNAVILNESELWLDTLFMAVLFLYRMGLRYKNKRWLDEAEYQVLLHIKYLYCKETGLFYHGFSFNRGDNFGGIFWCRGNSWLTLGLTLYLSEDGLSAAGRRFIEATFQTHAEALKRMQAPGGLFHTILDDPTSYEEVSGTAAMTAGLLRGIRLGILDESYVPVTQRALAAIAANISEDGTVLQVSAGTAMGMHADHYRGISIRPMAYGQALTLLALAEAFNTHTC